MNEVQVWIIVVALALIGALGGFINWFFNKEESSGCAGNVLFGALAPIFIIGIYGTLSPMRLNASMEVPNVGFAVSALALGFGGARVWSGERAKKELEKSKAYLSHMVRRLSSLK